MVQFGKKLLESRFEPWAEHYLDYKGLKKCLKKRYKKKQKKSKSNSLPLLPPFQQQQRVESSGTITEVEYGSNNNNNNDDDDDDGIDFEAFLEEEVEKIGLFFLQLQGELAKDLAELRKKQPLLSLERNTTIYAHQQQQQQQQGLSTTITHQQQQETTTERAALMRSSSVISSALIEEGTATGSSAASNQQWNDLYGHYHALASLLLHLIHFVESNVTGIRKILKKHDKITKKHLTYEFVSRPRVNNNRELKHLWSDMLLRQYDGITALNMTLKVALTELKNLEYNQHYQHQQPKGDGGNANNQKPPVKSRHHPATSMPNIILTLKDLAAAASMSSGNNKNNNSTATMTPQQLSSKTPYGSCTNHNSNSNGLQPSSHEVDIILLKVEAARRRLNLSSNTFQDMLAAQIVLLEPTGSEDDLLLDDDDDDALLDDKWLSHLLNLTSTFLYMTNYYVVAPTSGHYAKMLGGDEALAGIIIGMTPIAALVSTVLYSWWTSHSYKSALLFASTCSIVGNICYAIALPYQSLTLVMVGRLLNGFGSARSINRRYIADTFPPRQRTAQSANFVTAGALGMAAGPAIATLLHIGSPDNDFRGGTVHNHVEETIYEDTQEAVTIVTDDDTLLFNNQNVWWTPENAPGWFMMVVWSFFWFFLWMYFEDPPKHVAPTKAIPKTIETTKGGAGENRALLSSQSEESNSEDGDNNNEDDGEIPLWRNIPVMVTFVVYFVLKVTLECLLSSTATLTSFYFNWGSRVSGVYLSILGLLMLPANLGVAILARKYDDKELIVVCEVAMLLGCLGIIQFVAKENYSAIQYVFFSIVVFVSTNALEGPNMSLLSKTIPKSWRQGIFNVGLLATEAGTLGRAIGDLLLSYYGFNGLGTVLNDTFITNSIFSALALAVTLCFFEHLEPFEKDDY